MIPHHQFGKAVHLMSQSQKMTVAKDTMIYMFAKAIEGVLGIVTLAVYTRLLTDAQFGRYDIINKAVIIIGPLCMLWLQQAAGRYVNTYEAEGKQKTFYSTVAVSWLFVNAVLLIIGASAIGLLTGVFGRSGAAADFLARFEPRWLWLALFCVIWYNGGQVVLTMAGARRRILLNMSLPLITAALKLLIPLALVLRFDAAVEWILLANLVCDMLIAIIGSIRLRIWQHVSLPAFSKETLLLFLAFGLPLIGNFATTTALNYADRFLIVAYLGENANGIYAANHAIAAAAVTMLTIAVARGSYPNIMKAWGAGDKPLAVELVSQSVRLFMLLVLPAVVGLAVLSPRVAALVFSDSSSYSNGFAVMIWAGFGLLFLGLTEYSNKYWELSANTKIIFRNSAVSSVVNILLNIILLPRYGYTAAAFSSFVGFFIYFLLSKIESRRYMKWTLPRKSYVWLIAAAAVMGAAVWGLSLALPQSHTSLVPLVIAGVAVYFIVLIVSGEITPEMQYIRSKLFKGRKG